MIYHILFLIIGLALIIAGGNYVTNGAVAIANRFRLSPLLIGLTIVAFGSSTPDLCVSLFSTIHGKSALAVGNILGAVIFDILLVIGLMALIHPIKIGKNTLWCDVPILILGAAILFVCAEIRLFDPHGIDGLSRWDGVLMLVCFGVFMVYTLKIYGHHGTNPVQPQQEHPAAAVARQKSQTKPKPLWLAGLMVVIGLTALVFGGQWTVDSASAIAKKIGMSEGLIGLTIVGIGSSLPDLATSVIAAMKGQNGLALGNIIGSCIMDTLFVLGTCALVHPLAVTGISIVDFATLAGAAMLLLALGALSKNHTVGRASGAVLVLLYIAYMAYLIVSH